MYIFGGQRGKEYITDFLAYDVDTLELTTLQSSQAQVDGCTSDGNSRNIPQSGFTQRATFDTERDEIYVLTSLSKDKERRDLNVNSLWMYSLDKNEWSCIYKNDHMNNDGLTANQKIYANSNEPCPRYAHTLIYDPVSKVHYLFGGNPGGNNQIRLDDFWKLELEKPSHQQILKFCKYLIRKQHYEETTKIDSVKAIKYLQNDLFETIDQKNSSQLSEFHKLASLLFRTTEDSSQQLVDQQQEDEMCKSVSSPVSDMSTDESCSSTISTATTDFTTKENETDNENENQSGNAPKRSKFKFDDKKKMTIETRSQRCMLFNKLIELLPEKMCQPRGNLSDFVLI